MTHATWTDDEQHHWLKAYKARFIEANQTRVASKEIFSDIVKASCEKWPVPAASQEEIDQAGSIELAMRNIRNKYEKVLVLTYAHLVC